MIEPERNRIPWVLDLALGCRQMNALPYEGGYLDQPLNVLRKMETALMWFDIFTQYNRALSNPESSAKWMEKNPRETKVCQQMEMSDTESENAK